jgi:hemolysin activation/secretion protein
LSVNEVFTLGLSLDLRQSKTYLLDERFAFTTGTDDGKTNLSVIRLSQEWIGRNRSQVVAGRSLFSAGVNAFGATVNGEPRDGKFFSWLGQMQWVRRIPGTEMQFIFRTDVQYTNDGLPSMERMTVGGANSVRGYRENRLVGDSGVVSSLEFRYPLKIGIPGGGQIQLASFFDYGKVSNRGGPDPDPDQISSIGVGVLGTVAERVNFNLYYGYPFRDFDDPNEDPQDKGVHFFLNLRLL